MKKFFENLKNRRIRKKAQKEQEQKEIDELKKKIEDELNNIGIKVSAPGGPDDKINVKSIRIKGNPIKRIISCFIVALLLISITVGILNGSFSSKKISYSEAQNHISAGEFSEVEINTETNLVYMTSKEDGKVKYTCKAPNIEVFSKFMYDQRNNGNEEVKYNIITKSEFSRVLTALIAVLPEILLFVLLIKSTKKLFTTFENSDLFNDKSEFDDNQKKSKITFSDVAGIDAEIEEVSELVNILKNPETYKTSGARIPKGALLVGEPGTGKTLIAKAIAGEAGVPFYNCSGSSFENKYVGVGAAKVRSLFDTAKKHAPCVIFIDEIDAVAKKRYENGNYSEQTLNQLLAEMDGFDEYSGILMIAATNHLEVLDPAITRPGRFDRIINIPVPDKQSRYEILKVHARNKCFDLKEKEIILNELAKKTSGMSGAQLENILNESAIISIRNDHDYITREDASEAFIKVVVGVSQQDKPTTPEKKHLVSVHEAGHAIIGRIKRPEREILEISIIPRGQAGGYTLFADSDNNLPFEQDLKNSIMVALGGRAAEEIMFDSISVGASSDLTKASSIAHDLIYKYAMGNSSNLVRLYGKTDYNDKLEETMFPNMKKIMDDLYEETKECLKKHKDLLENLTQTLENQSTLNSDKADELFKSFSV